MMSTFHKFRPRSPKGKATDKDVPLSGGRVREIKRMVSEGASHELIASTLGISLSSVRKTAAKEAPQRSKQ